MRKTQTKGMKIILPHGQCKVMQEELGISDHTLKNYLNSAYGKYSRAYEEQERVRRICVARYGAECLVNVNLRATRN